MLTDLSIKNYTVVTELHVEFNQGLCVLSGETGAGKSILVDALQLALGARADSKAIKQNETRAEITLCFSVNDVTATWLEQHDFNTHDNECILTRVLQRDGRSRSTLNGKPIPVGLVRDLSQHLVRIHGQHQSHTLLQRHQQQQLLDWYAKNSNLLTQLKTIHQQWREKQTERKKLQALSSQREEQLSFLQYQLQELVRLNLQDNEWETLHREHQQLHNARKLLSEINQAIVLTDEHDSPSSTLLLQQAISHLQSIQSGEQDTLNEVIKLLNTAAIHLQEANDELTRYRDGLDLSPERLHFIEQRLSELHDMARKHHCGVEQLPSIAESLRNKIDKLEQSDEHLAVLETEIQSLEIQHQTIATQVSSNRKKAAARMSKQISQDMQTLGMQGGEFSVHLEPQQGVNPNGNEQVSFWVKTNPGQNTQPMSTVVSGGELSRISLALQSLIATEEPVPTFIFDEVDVGIGGQTAEIVGKLLRNFSHNRQVFCITHLPQVAGAGNHHYKVIKKSDANSTSSSIQLLTGEQRVHELARMISGSKISEQTLKHAEQLIY